MKNNKKLFLYLAAIVILGGIISSLIFLKGGDRPNVIFILLDAARADRFGCYGYGKETSPNIDAMAAEGVVCLNNFSNGRFTLESVPSYFYSRYYIKSLFPADPDIPLQEPENLFHEIDSEAISMAGVFKAAGYRTVLFSAHPWLVKGQKLVEDFDEFYRVKERHSAHADAGTVYRMVEKWLEENSDRPFFMYIHLMDPHTPHKRKDETLLFADPDYNHQEKFDRHGNPRGQFVGPYGDWRIPDDFNEDDLSYLNALYDGDIRYGDRCFGEFLRFLKKKKLYDRTLMVIGADHGEHLGEHGLSQHGGKAWDAVIKTPLIMRLPGKVPAGATIDFFTENVDILPTLVGVAGIPIPEGKVFDGDNVFEVTPDSESAKWALTLESIRSGEFKYILDRETGEELLYDLKEDPAEITNLAGRKPPMAAELKNTMARLLSRSKERYAKAVRKSPPRLPFAIPANYFKLESNSPIQDIRKFNYPWQDKEIISQTKSRPVWIHNTKSGRDYILGFNQPGLSPLLIKFPVPNGEYRVSLNCPGGESIHGYPGSVFKIRPGSDETSPAILVNTGIPSAPQRIDLGIIMIENNSFEAVIDPISEPSWIMARYFGFEPILSAAEAAEIDQEDAAERRKRLKSLGYAQ
jgi:arylsulfatase A-like enzyme